MPISDLCSNDLITTAKDATLRTAAQQMKQHHVGSVVVVEYDGAKKPVGMLTDRDIVVSVVAEMRSNTTPVQEVMSTNVVKVPRGLGIADAVDQMERNGVRRMVVVDEYGNACGVVSSDDILQLVARELNGLGRIVDRQLENERTYKTLPSEMLI